MMNSKIIENMFVILGLMFVFSAIWVNGWLILRLTLTGIVFMFMGWSIYDYKRP